MSDTFLIVAVEHRACQISCTIEKIRLTGDPAVAENSDVKLEVFVVGAVGNAQYHKRQNTTGGATASPAVSLSRVLLSSKLAKSIHCFPSDVHYSYSLY